MRLLMHVHSCCPCGIHVSLQVKLPITLEGAKAARRLISDGVPVTMTGECISEAEVVSAAVGLLSPSIRHSATHVCTPGVALLGLLNDSACLLKAPGSSW